MEEEKKSFLNKIAGWFSPEDDEAEYQEDYYEAPEEVEEKPEKPEKPTFKSAKRENKNTKFDEVKALNIKIIKPGDDKSAITTILDSLKCNQVVVVNFEDTRNDIRASFADAFFGATYVLGANYSKLSESAYVLAPQNVSVSPLIAEMAETETDKGNTKKTYFGNF